MSEMMDETLDSIEDNEDELEEDAQEEVDKVLWQITEGKLGQVGAKVGSLPVCLCSLIFTPRSRSDAPVLLQQTAAPTLEETQRDEEMERAIAGLLST